MKYFSMLIFRKFKFDYSYSSNLNLKTDFLVYEIVNLKMKFSRIYEKSTEMPMKSWIWKRHSHEIMNMKTNFLWNHGYETENAMKSWIWNPNFCENVNLKWHLMKCKLCKPWCSVYEIFVRESQILKASYIQEFSLSSLG